MPCAAFSSLSYSNHAGLSLQICLWWFSVLPDTSLSVVLCRTVWYQSWNRKYFQTATTTSKLRVASPRRSLRSCSRLWQTTTSSLKAFCSSQTWSRRESSVEIAHLPRTSPTILFKYVHRQLAFIIERQGSYTLCLALHGSQSQPGIRRRRNFILPNKYM